jgi:hypothetical protein
VLGVPLVGELVGWGGRLGGELNVFLFIIGTH